MSWEEYRDIVLEGGDQVTKAKVRLDLSLARGTKDDRDKSCPGFEL